MAVCQMQSYKLGDQMVTYADLGKLRTLRTELKAEIAQIQGTRPGVAQADFRGNF